MALSFQPHVICPVLVGRAPFIAALERNLHQARAGQGRAVVLAGEAGIGKSRLAAEARRLAAGLGMGSLQGNCYEPDRVLPYAPLIDLIRTALQDRPEAAQALKPYADELVKLLPELAGRLPGVAPSPPLEPEQEKRRLFQALLAALAEPALSPATGAEGSVGRLIVVEDLHWSDDTSLAFLLHLSRQLPGQPACLLLTYRADETTPALTRFLAELDRGRLATELALGRLNPPEAAEMIAAIFAQAQPVRADFVEAIHHLTDGNPFFIEESLKSLVAAGDIFPAGAGWTRKPVAELQIPRSVHDAVNRRAAQLSGPARQLLTLAAVIGQRVPLALLQPLTGHHEAGLLALLKELAAAQLMVDESADTFRFRHALTRQAIYADLLGRERRNLHRAIAEALQAQAGPDSPAADLAYHCFEAGLWQQAFHYARQAAERAQALYTPRAAAEHLSRAILAAQHLSATLPLDLYRARGQQYQTLGDFEAAAADYQTALDEGRARGDGRSEWQALIDLGFLWAARDFARTGDYFQRALGAARSLNDPAALAHTLNRVGNWHLNVGRAREALRYHHEALSLFESLDDKPGLASTHDLLGITYYASNDVHSGIAHYDIAMALFKSLGDRGGLASALVIYASRGSEYIGGTAMPMRMPREARLAASQEALRLARETGALPAEAITTLWLGMNLAAGGEYGRGLELVNKGLELALAIEHQHFGVVGHMILGMCYLDLLAHAPACEHLKTSLALAEATGSAIWIGTATAYLSLAHTRQGDLDRATAVLAQAFAPDTPMETMGQCQLWAAWAELLLAQGLAAEALAAVEDLIRALPNVEVVGEHGNPRLSLLRGEALVALRRYATAEKVLRGALASAQALELPPHEWRAWASLSRALRAQGRRAPAEEAAALAAGIVERLAGTLAEAGLQEAFRLRAAARWSGPATGSPRRAAKQRFGGLTSREREVAGLIAAGQSNLEIAAALSLSHRTVEAHVSNILSKLGFGSRAQVAVWAVENGLAK